MKHEYVRKEAALKAVCQACSDNCNSPCIYYRQVTELPTADVVEVVRCKDCHRSFRDSRGERYCNHLVSRWNTAESPRYVNDYDYCSWGVREGDNG